MHGYLLRTRLDEIQHGLEAQMVPSAPTPELNAASACTEDLKSAYSTSGMDFRLLSHAWLSVKYGGIPTQEGSPPVSLPYREKSLVCA